MKRSKILNDMYIIFKINMLSLRTAIVPYFAMTILLPLGFTYLISLAFKNMIPLESAINMLIGVIVLSLSLSIVNGVGQNLGQDRLLKRLELISSYPVSPASYIIGVSLVFIISNLINITVIVIVGGIVWHIKHLVLSVFPQLIALSLIASLGLIGIGAIIGTRSTTLPQTYALTNIVSFIVAMLTPAYYPIEIMPTPLYYISQILPTTHAALIARNLLKIGEYNMVLHLILLIILSIIYIILGFKGMKWYEE